MRRIMLVTGVAAVARVTALVAAAAQGKSGGGFVNYSLAETTGTTCPGSARRRTEEAA